MFREGLSTLCLYSADDVTSKRYYDSDYTRLSVISFLLNGFITLLHRVLCDKKYNNSLYTTYIINMKLKLLYLLSSCLI